MSDYASESGTAVEIVSETISESVKAVAIVIGADPIASAAIGGAAGGATKALVKFAKRRLSQMTTFVGAATEYGGEFEHLVEAALEDDRKLDLLRRALEATYRTADRNRIRFYARIAAEGLLENDDALVDEKDRILSSLATLDPPDLKVLFHMATGDRWNKHFQDNQSKTVAVDLPEVVSVLDAVFARLETLGLISSADEGGLAFGVQWKVTAFGRLCVDELHNQSALDKTTR